MSLKALSVTEVVSKVKKNLEGEDFCHLMIEGEISNLTFSAAGHWYFTLKDLHSALQVSLFRGHAMRNPLIKKIKGGEQVICSGSLGVYTKRGTFQLICKSFSLLGEGDLNARFEALKKKLAGEGLFDRFRKRPLPPFPQKVGVITSKSGAAFQDFINVYRRRSLWMDVTLIPALVQGEKAPQSLIKALNLSVQKGDFDVLVLTRGGGSLEDLWAFNHEGLARALFSCPFPVVSAVGHQVDFTIADHVADVRAETPTAAAELLTESQTKITDRLSSSKKMILLQLSKVISFYRQKLLEKSPTALAQVMRDKVLSYERRLMEARKIFHPTVSSAFFRFHETDLYLDDLINRGRGVLTEQIKKDHNLLESFSQLLQSYSAEKVLRRGYTYLSSPSGAVSSYKDFQRLPKSQRLKVHFYDGEGSVSQNPSVSRKGKKK